MLAVGSYWRVTYMCAYMKCYLGKGYYWADQQQFKGETIVFIMANPPHIRSI